MCKLILLSLFLMFVFSIVAAFAFQPPPIRSLDMTVTAVVLTNTYVFEALSSTQIAAETATRAPRPDPLLLTATAVAVTPTLCAGMGFVVLMPELSLALQQALVEAGFTTATAQIMRFGEGCQEYINNELVITPELPIYFDVSIELDEIPSQSSLTDQVTNVLTVLHPFLTPQVESVPLGSISITFAKSDESYLQGFYLSENDVLRVFEQGNDEAGLSGTIQAMVTPFTTEDYGDFAANQTRTASWQIVEATQTAAAETATRAPRPDPLLLTATAIARQ
jgi:hypothetical protein